MHIEIYLEDDQNHVYTRKVYSSSNPDVDAIKTFLEQFKRDLTMVYSKKDNRNIKGINDREEG
jgi:hypothetical protein